MDGQRGGHVDHSGQEIEQALGYWASIQHTVSSCDRLRRGKKLAMLPLTAIILRTLGEQ